MPFDVSPALGLTVDSSGVIRATSDLKKLPAAAKTAEDSARKLGKGGEDMARGLDAGARAADRLRVTMGGLIGRLIAAGTAALTVGAYARMADTWSDLRSVVGAATGDMAGASAMMERLVAIADASYSPLAQTVEIYSQNVRVLNEMGRSAQDAADFTESLNHMLVLTATKGQRAASVQAALSKAMAVGKLQAEGLETVVANGAEVAGALARELGITTNELRAAAAAGKITGDVIADALVKSLDDVRARAEEMPATIGDGFQKIQNATLHVVGAFDQWAGISGALAERLGELSQWINSFAQADFAAWADKAAVSVDLLAAAIAGLAATSVTSSIAALITTVNGVGLAFAIQYHAVVAFNGALTVMRGIVASLGGPLGIAIGAATALGTAYYLLSRRQSDHMRLTGEAETAMEAYRGGIGRTTEAIQRQTEAIGKLSLAEASRTLESRRAAAEEARKQFDAVSQMEFVSPFKLPQPLADLEGLISLYKDGNIELGEWVARLAEIAGGSDQAAKYARDILDAYQQMRTANDDLVTAQTIMEEKQRAIADLASETAAATEAQVEAQSKMSDDIAEMVRSYERRAEVVRAETQYGEESLQVLAVRLSHERELLEAKLRQKGASKEEAAAVVAAWQAAINAEHGTRLWNAAVIAVRDNAKAAAAYLRAIADARVPDNWLDAAISKAETLASKLLEAAAAKAAALGGSELAPGTSPAPPRRPFELGETGGGLGGGGGGALASSIDALISDLQTERETLEAWHTERLDMLARATDAELAAIGGRNEAKLRLEQEYQDRLRGIVASERDYRVSETADMFSALADVAAAGGERMLKVQAALSAAAAIISGYEAAMKAAAEAKTIAGRIAAYARFVALGLSAAARIRSAGKSGGGGGGGAGSATAPAAAVDQAQPVNVSIAGVDPDSWYQGSQIQALTTAVQKDLQKRGVIITYVGAT